MTARPTIELGFYRGRSAVSRLIRWQTRSVYSHVAGRLANGEHVYDGRCPPFDAGAVVEAWHAPWPGGVFARRDWFEGHTDETRVDVFAAPALTPAEAEAAWDWVMDVAIEVPPPRYDYRAILRFLSRRRKPADGRWFCSELWAAAFAAVGRPLLARVPAGHVSPAMLAWSTVLAYSHSTMRLRWGNVVSWVDPAMAEVKAQMGEAARPGRATACAMLPEMHVSVPMPPVKPARVPQRAGDAAEPEDESA